MTILLITTNKRKKKGGGTGSGSGRITKGSTASRMAKYLGKKFPKKKSYQNENGNPTTLFSNEAHYVHKDGKQYLVVPGVPVQEQVMNTYLLPADEIQKSLDSWNGTPLSIRHAQQNGGSVQVDNPDVPIIGYFSNATWDAIGKRMLGDYWIDVTEAMKYPEGQVIMNTIQQGAMVETSTAYWADEEYTPGSFKGKSYSTIHRNPKRDHIAIFPGGQVGACSIDDGCGVNRNMQQNCEQCEALHQQGAAHPWHKGRPGEKGGSTSTSAGAAQAATAKADRATKLAMEQRTPEAYKTAMDYHMRAAKANFEAYQDTRNSDPEAASSFKRMVSEHEGTAQILERRMGTKKNSNDGYPEYKPNHLPTIMLIGYALNKGYRTQVQMDSARAFVESNGITKPVWVQCDDGKYKILDGNHRVYLADELDIDQVPVRVVNGHLMELDPEAVYREWLHEQDQGYMV